MERPSPWPVFVIWAPVAAAATVICLFVNLAVQQSFRTSADDPQIQLAEDTATGQMVEPQRQPREGLPAVDIGSSLASWVAVYDDTGRPVVSSGRLHGIMPELPPGIFDYVREHGLDRVTWKPEAGLRIALIVVRTDGANPHFVASGRSLRETERRIDSLNLISLLGWVGALIAALLATLVFGPGFQADARRNGDAKAA